MCKMAALPKIKLVEVNRKYTLIGFLLQFCIQMIENFQ